MDYFKKVLKYNSIAFLIITILTSANPNFSTAQKNPQSLISLQENQAVKELIVIDSSIKSFSNKVNSTEKEIVNLKSYLSKIQKDLKETSAKTKQKKITLNKRIKAIYKDRDTSSLLEIILSSKSVSDLISKVSFINLIAKNDQNAITSLARQEEKIKDLEVTINNKITELNEIRDENKKSYNEMLYKMSSRKEFIQGLKNKKSNLDAISKQANEVNEKIESFGPSKAPSGKTIRVLTTGYGANCSHCGTNGKTSTGLAAGRGIAAVSSNPGSRVVPLGSKIYIPGYGKAVVADIGGGVSSSQIDLCFETHNQAINWGSKWVTITVYK